MGFTSTWTCVLGAHRLKFYFQFRNWYFGGKRKWRYKLFSENKPYCWWLHVLVGVKRIMWGQTVILLITLIEHRSWISANTLLETMLLPQMWQMLCLERLSPARQPHPTLRRWPIFGLPYTETPGWYCLAYHGSDRSRYADRSPHQANCDGYGHPHYVGEHRFRGSVLVQQLSN
jgi:hypothetical protein